MYLSRRIRIPRRPPVAVAVSAPFSSSPPEARNPLKVGSTLREVRRFSASDVAAYSAVSGDQNPLHSDPEFARRIAGFERGSIVHGMLVATLFPTVIASHFVGILFPLSLFFSAL
ncbi:Enoyl-CoA hydratase 2, peroxisomal [Platanthera guangdongensis]|uniref:Enoyl-CoA hydratase 2, peroxisomal n=1 Tax=Platanthera guangdongensis TaxID=2320717 RepID=A0ABR2LY83_9ASPA